jgi:glycine oxidase
VADRWDVVIIGAGIVGLASARELARTGKRVLLLDRGEPGSGASWAAAGMLAPQVGARAGDPLLALGVEARERYAALAADLGREGHDVGLRLEGITKVAFDDESERTLQAAVADQTSLGLDAVWLSRRDLVWRHPGIAPTAQGAFLAPKDGSVDNVTLCAALVADVKRHGVSYIGGEVVDIVTSHGRATGVRTEFDHHHAGTVVLAAGAWSASIAGLPRRLFVEPVRGQMALAPWPANEPKGIVFGRAGYVVARGDSAVVGSTMERAGFDGSTTDAGLAHVRAEAGALFPALGSVMFSRAWAALRPMTPDGLPILGPDPVVDGLIYATGHGKNGILLGPITGEIVRDLVVHGSSRRDIAPFSVSRFEA